MRILIVEDAVIIRTALYEMLKRPDVEIDTAESCGEALRLLQENAYDWVTLDLRLPDGSGIDILEAIRLQRPDTRVAVISFDAYDRALRKRVLSLGATAVFPKPFDEEEFINCIYGS